jgi:diguanylate cyclase (GGDEF)-like protein
MSPIADVLAFASATVAVVACSLTAFGLRRECYAGWRWWVAALWLTTLGTLLGALLPDAAGAMLATPLLLQWPLVTLIGLRRFHARQVWPGSAALDAALLAAATLGTAGALALQGADAQGWVTACGMAVHLYTATVLFLGAGDREGTPVQGLGAVIGVAAFAPGLAALPAQPWLPLQARAAAAALGAIVLAFVVLTLVCERTERQLRDSRRRLRTLANLDALTQVPNRRHFGELALRALRQDPPGSAVLLMFDIDHFKLVNDHLGHAAGDRALRLVSRCVQEHLRVPDVAGRHGGDEFVLLLRHAATADAMGVAGRIVAAVQQRGEDHQLPALSLSFGLVQVGPQEDLDAALRRADQALYEAKRQGRSCAVAALGDASQPVFSESQRLGLTTC